MVSEHFHNLGPKILNFLLTKINSLKNLWQNSKYGKNTISFERPSFSTLRNSSINEENLAGNLQNNEDVDCPTNSTQWDELQDGSWDDAVF